VWTQPIDPTTVVGYPLGRIYPSCEKLFCKILGIRDTQIAPLLAQANTIGPSSQLQDIVQLFIRIDQTLTALNSPEAYKSVQSLYSSSIFPILINESESSFDHLSTGDKPGGFWVADRRDLLDSFRGIVPLLAFKVEEVGQMSRLLKVLGLETRKLSSAAKVMSIARGRVLYNGAYSSLLRARAKFIIRYDLISHFNFKSVGSYKIPRHS
jgi:hypothetical protein